MQTTQEVKSKLKCSSWLQLYQEWTMNDGSSIKIGNLKQTSILQTITMMIAYLSNYA